MKILSKIMTVKGIHLTDDISNKTSQEVHDLLHQKKIEVYTGTESGNWLWYSLPNEGASEIYTQITFDQSDRVLAKDFFRLTEHVAHF